MSDTRPTMGSLFAGIGGFDLGFERAGFRALWQVEIDPHASHTLRAHFPGATQETDITTVLGGELAPVDVITAGFPCQDLSVAGRRLGLAGGRSGLFFEIPRIVREMREATDGAFPKFLLLENVPGLLSSHSGRDFAVVLEGLAQCGALDIGWRVLDAQFFALAQRRRRVFLVVDLGAERSGQVLALAEGGTRHPPTRRAPGERVTGALADSAGKRGWSSSVDVQPWVEIPALSPSLTAAGHDSSEDGRGRHALIPAVSSTLRVPSHGGSWRGDGCDNLLPVEPQPLNGDVSYALAAGAGGNKFGSGRGGQDSFVGVDLRNGSLDGDQSHTLQAKPNGGMSLHTTPHVLAFTERTRGGDRAVETQEELAYAVRDGGAGTASKGAVAMAIRTAQTSSNGHGLAEESAYTLDSAQGQAVAAMALTTRTRPGGRSDETQEELAYALNNPGQGGRTQEGRVLTPAMAVRRLTPLECCRLQGFPDDWLDNLDLADSTKYRLLGNAVAVPVVEWLARRMREVLP